MKKKTLLDSYNFDDSYPDKSKNISDLFDVCIYLIHFFELHFIFEKQVYNHFLSDKPVYITYLFLHFKKKVK